MPDAYEARLAAAKRQSALHRLFRAARLANETALARVRAADPGVEIRAAHTALFPHIDLDGTPQIELARRLGVSKQAVGQLVDDLVAMGMVERRPDPRDGRVRRVAFTARGREALLHGLGVLSALEEELRARVGDEAMRALERGLDALLAALEESPPPR